MKKSTFLFSVIFILIVFSCKKDEGLDPNRTIKRICFGSCSTQHTTGTRGIYSVIAAQQPQLYIAGGDNIYGDFFAILPGTKDYMIRAYEEMWADKYVQTVYGNPNIECLATWDDHDYGQNDGVIDNTAKVYAKELFFKYWNIPENSPRRLNPSGEIYGSHYYGDDAHKVQVILLDLRWAHSKYKKGGAAGALSGYDTIMDPGARMMSDEQWTWLEGQLSTPAKVRIVVTSLQFSASYNGGEAWTVLPLEQQRMINLIKSTQANGLFFISGDVHFADVNVMNPADCYPIYDFTSSGLTHSEDKPYNSTNRVLGLGAPFTGLNFGQIDIDWEASPVKITITARDKNNNPKITKVVDLDELSF